MVCLLIDSTLTIPYSKFRTISNPVESRNGCLKDVFAHLIICTTTRKTSRRLGYVIHQDSNASPIMNSEGRKKKDPWSSLVTTTCGSPRQLIVTATFFRATLREQAEDHGRPSHKQIHNYASALFFHFFALSWQHIFRSSALCSSLASKVALAHF